MRKAFDRQRRLDCPSVAGVPLNFNCRNQTIPILRGLQHIYSRPEVRDSILRAIGRDVNGKSKANRGRPGLDYWEILVLAAARLGCGYDYDQLQDLAENHRALRQVMGIGDWQEEEKDQGKFDWRRIRDNLTLLSPETIEKINQTIIGLDGWRQHQHLQRKTKKLVRKIERIAARKGNDYQELYKRGKAGEPIQFGRLVLIYEDGAGFITHYHLLPRDKSDRDVVVQETRKAQKRHQGRIRRGSFERGFHSPENQKDLAKILQHPCLPMSGANQAAQQEKTASVEFRDARQSHPGVESAIAALQSGNGLERCRDRTERGFARYIGLGALGRNLHVLGKLLIARESPNCLAAYSRRKPAA